MKTTALNLAILDDNTVVVGPLSAYLNGKFGSRVNISTFFDAEKCIRHIDEDSHVIILNYFLNGGDKSGGSGLKNLNYIKKLNPKTDVTMITSDKDMAVSTEEFQREVSEYIIKRESGSYDMLGLLDNVVLSPIKTRVLSPVRALVTLPIRKIIHYHSVKNYLMMFLITFICVGVLVIAGFLGLEIISGINSLIY